MNNLTEEEERIKRLGDAFMEIGNNKLDEDKAIQEDIFEAEDDVGSIDNFYNYCPLCGVNWENKPEEHKCDRMLLVDQKKPNFDIGDLNHYNEEFLRDIIIWQDLKIKALEDISKVSANDLDLKR